MKTLSAFSFFFLLAFFSLTAQSGGFVTYGGATGMSFSLDGDLIHDYSDPYCRFAWPICPRCEDTRPSVYLNFYARGGYAFGNSLRLSTGYEHIRTPIHIKTNRYGSPSLLRRHSNGFHSLPLHADLKLKGKLWIGATVAANFLAGSRRYYDNSVYDLDTDVSQGRHFAHRRKLYRNLGTALKISYITSLFNKTDVEFFARYYHAWGPQNDFVGYIRYRPQVQIGVGLWHIFSKAG